MDAGKLLYVLEGESAHDAQFGQLEMFGGLGFKEVHLVGREGVLAARWPTSFGDMRLKIKAVKGAGKHLVKAVLEGAAGGSVSMIAVAMTGEKRKRFASSITRKLLLSSISPVLAMPLPNGQDITNKTSVFSHTLFATNWSKASERAFQYLLQFKSTIRALEVVNVVDSKLSVREMRAVKRRLTETRSRFLGREIDAEFHVYAGKRSREIALAAHDYGASCIVMGRDGKGRFRRFWANDCASRVVNRARIPILVVP